MLNDLDYLIIIIMINLDVLLKVTSLQSLLKQMQLARDKRK